VHRVVILGRGGAGKSTFARRLAAVTEIPATELDGEFWQAGLEPPPLDRWAAIQVALIAPERWILDGDLGPYDVLEPRLARADTVILLDFSLGRCVWRSLRRGRERADYWRWVWSWRRRSRPRLLASIDRYAAGATIHILRTPAAVADFLERVSLSG
jgi:adenylate kinase family enzyme